ncbi:MAG: fibronectin type III domain-containing protein, partial [Lachnospiraceae bacterium]|nr:fibronectin type III domain-containing protein [Lachnospiraceae bacterium]
IRITTKEYCRIMGLPYDEPEEDEPEKTAAPEDNTRDKAGATNPPDNQVPSVTTPPSAAKPVTPIVEQSKVTANLIKVKWNAVSGADSYRIYYGEKGKKLKKYVEVSGSKKTAKLKKLKKGKYYRIRLCAYKKADGKKNVIAASPDIYIATKGGSYNNPAAVKPGTKTLSVKAAGKAKIKAKIKNTGKQKVKYFVQKIRYISSDTSVAKVSKKGEVTGVSAGSCIIYCYTQNGKSGKVKVTVR